MPAPFYWPKTYHPEGRLHCRLTDYPIIPEEALSIYLHGEISETGMPCMKYWERKCKKATLLRMLEETYLELAGKYSEPVSVGGEHIWGRRGLFELLNEKLISKGYRPLTWEEFKGILEGFDSPDYYGRIYVSWLLSPKKPQVEPKTISFYEPVFLRRKPRKRR